MSASSRFSLRTVPVVLCLLLLADILTRWFGPTPVEATRISGRETDAAFQSLSGANEGLARANQTLAASVDRLSGELRGVQKWAEAEKGLAKAQEQLAKASEQLAQSILVASDALKAMNEGTPDSGDVGEEPPVEAAPEEAVGAE